MSNSSTWSTPKGSVRSGFFGRKQQKARSTPSRSSLSDTDASVEIPQEEDRLTHSDEFDPVKSWKARKQKRAEEQERHKQERKLLSSQYSYGTATNIKQEKPGEEIRGVKRKRVAVPTMPKLNIQMELEADGWAQVAWEECQDGAHSVVTEDGKVEVVLDKKLLKLKKQRVKRPTKAIKKEITKKEKIFLSLAVYFGHYVSSFGDDPEVQALLFSLLPDVCHRDRQRVTKQDKFLAFLEKLIKWWRIKFKFQNMTGPVDVSDLKSELERMRCGTPIGSLAYTILFVSLCRSLGFHIPKIKSSIWKEDDAELLTEGKERLLKEWVEIYSDITEQWLPVNVTTEKFGESEISRIKKLSGNLYIFGFFHHFITDITPRYCAKWSEVYASRSLDGRWINSMLMKLMLQIRRRQVATLELKEGEDNLGVVKKQALDILGKEQEKFREFKKSEGIPENISAFQKHHLYCLDRFLNQNQIIWPNDVEPIADIKGAKVYPRNAVRTVYTRDKWLSRGKQIAEGAIPMKKLPKKGIPLWVKCKKSKPGVVEEGASEVTGVNAPETEVVPLAGSDIFDLPKEWTRRPESEEGKGKEDNEEKKQDLMDYFGSWQVEPYKRPVADSETEIPTNKYGNVYLFKRSMVPVGCTHVVYPKLRKILNELQIPFVPAMVGWERGGFSKPLLHGFVVLSKHHQMVRDACHVNFKKRTKKFLEKRREEISKSWLNIFSKCLLFIEKQKNQAHEAEAEEEESKHSKEVKQTTKGSAVKKNEEPVMQQQQQPQHDKKNHTGPKQIYKQMLKPMRDKKKEVQWSQPHRHNFTQHAIDEITGMVTKICDCGFKLTTEEL